MNTTEQIAKRLRDARPELGGSPPPFSVVVAAMERSTQEPGPRGWWRRGRVVVPAALAVLVLAGAGGTVLLLTPGAPLPPAFVLPANPATGLGQPLPASLELLPMQVADPAGGPPWAMRVIRTTRGLVCLQAGRVVDGQLGAIGSGYAFSGDGHFHPFLPADAIGTDACPAVGTTGQAFLPGPPVIVPANGLELAGENLWPGERVHCDLPGQENWGVRCPQAELRQVAMGLLGADASSIQIATEGHSFTVKPYGPEGAYLIVLPAQPNADTGLRSGAYTGPFGYSSNAPGGAVLTITYNDGSHCQIPTSDSSQQCHAHSPSPEPSSPSSAQLSSPVQVSYVQLDQHPVDPLIADARSSNPDSQQSFASGAEPQPGPALTMSFDARHAAEGAGSAYVVELRPQEVPGCATPSLIVSQPTNQTIAAGETVQITVPLLDSCKTSYTGRVFYAQSSSIGGEGGGEGPLYEVIAGQVNSPPGSGRSPEHFPTVGRFHISVP
ncbi:MAG: hypothetical protein ACRDK2_10535 [Solirubrobacteraceae bacterium]